MSVPIQIKDGTAAPWTTANPVLMQREMGVETDTGRMKVCDGVTAWAALPFAGQFSLAIATDVLFANTPEPATPASDKVEFYARKIAGRLRFFTKGPTT